MSFWQTMSGKFQGKEAPKKKVIPKRTVVTAEQMGTGMAVVALEGARNLMKDFEKQGITASLTLEQYLILGLEVLALEVVCTTFSLVRMYRNAGYNVGHSLARWALEGMADNVKAEDVSEFVGAGLKEVNAHYQYYSKDLWNMLEITDKEEFERKMPRFGLKLLRRILHPVLGISLTEPDLHLKPGEDFSAYMNRAREAYKELEPIPVRNRLLLEQSCAMHAILTCGRRPEIEQNFSLSDD